MSPAPIQKPATAVEPDDHGQRIRSFSLVVKFIGLHPIK